MPECIASPSTSQLRGGFGGGGGGAAAALLRLRATPAPHPRDEPAAPLARTRRGGGGWTPWPGRLTPGDYTLRLTVDGQTYTQPATVKPDPRGDQIDHADIPAPRLLENECSRRRPTSAGTFTSDRNCRTSSGTVIKLIPPLRDLRSSDRRSKNYSAPDSQRRLSNTRPRHSIRSSQKMISPIELQQIAIHLHRLRFKCGVV